MADATLRGSRVDVCGWGFGARVSVAVRPRSCRKSAVITRTNPRGSGLRARRAAPRSAHARGNRRAGDSKQKKHPQLYIYILPLGPPRMRQSTRHRAVRNAAAPMGRGRRARAPSPSAAHTRQTHATAAADRQRNGLTLSVSRMHAHSCIYHPRHAPSVRPAAGRAPKTPQHQHTYVQDTTQKSGGHDR